MGLYEGIKDVASVIQKADNLELYRNLLDLSAQALEMQSQINNLSIENKQLKEKIELEHKICRHKELYVTLENDNLILYCAHCWDSERKLIQLKTKNGTFLCPHCNTDGIYNYEEYNEHKNQERIMMGKYNNRHMW